MKARLRGQGNDGKAHYEPGAIVEIDSEWIRRMLVNGLAEAMDDVTKAIAEHPSMVERYRSEALVAAAQGMSVANADIPALTVK